MEHTPVIICGDAASVLDRLEDKSVDLVLTDAPYLCNYRDRTGRSLQGDNSPDMVLPVFPHLYRVLKDHNYCLLFCGWNAIPQFSAAWQEAGFRTAGHIVWRKSYTSSARHLQYQHESAWLLRKGNPAPPDKPLADMQEWTYSGNRLHPTEKAVEVIAPLVRAFSKPGDVVLDPFLGSGTTAVAAALNGRQAIGIELEARYCELAKRRLAGVQRFVQKKRRPAQQKIAA